MRPFYLGKNKHGYYRAYFVDAVTGQITSAKSTHTKDKIEAAELEWAAVLAGAGG